MVASRLGDRLTQRIGKSAEVTITNPITLDLGRVVARLKEAAIGEIQRNTMAGKDRHGRPLAAYSPSYREALRRGGESTDVDLHITGDFLRNVKATAVRLKPDSVEVDFGWGDTRSEQRNLADGAAKKTGKRGPTHRQLAAWLIKGTPNMPARPIGLTKEAMRRLVDLVRRAGVFKQR